MTQEQEYRKWVYPPDYPFSEAIIVLREEHYNEHIARGWHPDTKFIQRMTSLREEIKKLEKLLKDRKERLAELEGPKPGPDTEEEELKEQVCNVCGMTFFTKQSYADHMVTHRR